jgi:hypothetical protein
MTPSVAPAFRDLLQQEAGNIALLLGNGINRHNNISGVSWEQILTGIGVKVAKHFGQVPKGTSLTEFYNAIELKSAAKEGDLQAEFCRSMSAWMPAAHHHTITAWALRHGAPVLTTNFDELLSTAASSQFRLGKAAHFVDRYPWNCRFAADVVPPCSAFGIWHINGLARYRRSIRLGLTHYMGSVQRARVWLHGKNHALFAMKEKDIAKWQGADTWLHVLFHKPLVILGLALEENEVFLRWLLLERAAYFKRYPSRKQAAWYVSSDDVSKASVAGKKFFLNAVGIDWVPALDYQDIYENPSWVL